ncbi:MAG: FG-GAP-like repeat-containing protein [Planctomycetota bacterium]
MPLSLLVALLLAPFAADRAAAQARLFEFTGTYGTGKGYGASVALVGDVDRDGFGDILIGSPLDDTSGTDAGLAELRSGRNGSVIRRHFGDAPGQQMGTLVADLGDVDGDGVPDYAVTYPYAVTAIGRGVVRLFSGSSGNEIWAIIDGMANFATYVAAAGDLDGDQRGDIIVGSDREQRIFRGTGGLLLASVPNVPCVGVFDTNGNGVGEYAVVVTTASPSQALMRCYELPTTQTWESRMYAVSSGNSIVAAGDVNRDGLPDLLGASKNAPASSTTHRSGGFWVAGVAGAYLHGSAEQPNYDRRCILVSAGGDFDGDGWPDFVDAYRRWDLFVPFNSIPNGARVVSGRTGAFLFDFSLFGVGEVTAVAGPRGVTRSGYGAIAIGWKQGATERVTVFSGLDREKVGLGCGSGFEPPSMMLSALVVGQTATAFGSRSAAGIGSLFHSAPMATPISLGSCDLFVDPNTMVLAGIFAERPTFAQWAQGMGIFPNERYLTGDVNGDDRADVVNFVPNTGTWHVGISNGYRLLPHLPNWLGNHGTSTTREFLGDFDGDGKDDAIVVEPATGTWRVARSLGTGFQSPTQLATGFLPNKQDYLVGDVNGDGRTDLVVWDGAAPAAWHVALCNGTTVGTPSIWGYDGVGSSWHALADVNGDGRADAITFHVDLGAWSVQLSQVNSFAPPTPWSPAGHGTWSTQQLVADVNGDGKADAIAVQGGDWFVYLSTGTGFVNAGQWGGGLIPQGDGRLAGDIDGDGAADAIVHDVGAGRGLVFVAPSLASPRLGSLALPTFIGPGYAGWLYDVVIPNNSGLVGRAFAFQSAHWPSLTPAGVDLSNGVYGVIR